jgi:Sensors of blue-light using FAD
MISLTYFSTALEPFSRDELGRLLEHSRAKNAASGLTGMLLYAGGHFIQTLEGTAEGVDGAFSVIQADPRHRSIFIALREEIEERVFPDWSMGFEYQEADEAAAAPGFTDYLDASRAVAASAQEVGRAGVFHRVFRDRV